MIQTYENLLVALSQNQVDYILVGGLAVAFSGYARATFDLDILVEDSLENIERLLGVLRGFGTGSAKELTAADFTREEGSIRIYEGFPLDVFTLMRGNAYADLLPYAQVRQVSGWGIQYLGPEGLILLKAKSNRPKDQLDVVMMKKILGGE